MKAPVPHFLLFSESRSADLLIDASRGRWRFVLEAVDGSAKMEASHDEAEISGERLELLAVVRGLEALDQPSRVTLVTPSRYVCRGLRHGLQEWRENDWLWESFGKMTPIKDHDLWQRVDRALRYHQVECRTWRFDPPHPSREVTGKMPACPHKVMTKSPPHSRSAADRKPNGWRRTKRCVEQVVAIDYGCFFSRKGVSALGRLLRRMTGQCTHIREQKRISRRITARAGQTSQ